MELEINDNTPEWIIKLKDDGYCVIPNILTDEECNTTITKMWNWLESLGTGIDRNEQETWKPPNWPYSTRGIIQHLRVGHEEFIWDIRTNPNVIDVFKKIWNTDDLLVSFDAINIIKPVEITNYRSTRPWFHTDQGNRKKGLQCIQSFVNLEDCTTNDACFSCLPKSHLYHQEMLNHFNIEGPQDWIKLSNQHMLWFEEGKGCERIRVPVPKGGMVLWDSRTIHCNRPARLPRQKPVFRYTVYVCMTPREWCDEKNLEKKKKAFNEIRMTSHWPHHIKLFPNKPNTYGAILPNYNIRQTPPELNEIGMKLAGF